MGNLRLSPDKLPLDTFLSIQGKTYSSMNRLFCFYHNEIFEKIIYKNANRWFWLIEMRLKYYLQILDD